MPQFLALLSKNLSVSLDTIPSFFFFFTYRRGSTYPESKNYPYILHLVGLRQCVSLSLSLCLFCSFEEKRSAEVAKNKISRMCFSPFSPSYAPPRCTQKFDHLNCLLLRSNLRKRHHRSHRLATTCSSASRKLARYNKKATLSSRAIRLLPEELVKHAVSEGTKAVTKYTSTRS